MLIAAYARGGKRHRTTRHKLNLLPQGTIQLFQAVLEERLVVLQNKTDGVSKKPSSFRQLFRLANTPCVNCRRLVLYFGTVHVGPVKGKLCAVEGEGGCGDDS